MLLTKFKIEPSTIHGIGLFANQFIPKGTRIWQFSPGLDRQISIEEFAKMSAYEQNYIEWYGFLSKKTGQHHLSFDNVKFINHAVPGNVKTDHLAIEETEYPLVASKDIQPGEEITQDYKEFEDEGHGL